MSDTSLQDEIDAIEASGGFSRRSKLLIVGLASLPLLFIGGIFGYSLVFGSAGSSSVSGNTNETFNRVASTAPLNIDFELTTLEGETITPADLRGQWVMLDFWASWCTSCRVELPDLAAAYEKWQFSDVEFIGVVAWDNERSAREFAEEHRIQYPVALARTTFPAEFGVTALPEKFFISPDGEIHQVKLTGPVTEDKLDELLTTLTQSS